MPTLQILQNGQISLPAEFCRDLGMKKGDILNAEIQDGQIILTPVRMIEKRDVETRLERSLIEKACGMLKDGKASTKSLLRFRAEEGELEKK